MFKPYSFMFLLVISLLPTTVFAADDMQMDDVDESPAGFMARLREAEAASDIDEKGKFTLSQEFLNLQKFLTEIGMSLIKPSYMDGFSDYSEYFRALATSTRLTDEQKLKKEFVLIPYFKNLSYESEVVQDRELDLIEPGYSGPSRSCLYPYVRLFLSALGRIMHNVNLHKELHNPLVMSLDRADVSLTELLLKFGADPNAELTLKYCKTLKEAQLLVQSGADIGGQLEKCDLLSSDAIDEGDPDLLIFLLQHVELNVANDFGKHWLYCLACESFSLELDNFSEKLSALLETGCLYDEERILDLLNSSWFDHWCSREPEKAQKIIAAFTQAFEQGKRRKNIVHGLRERQRTGKSLRALQTNLRPCYKRALELHEKK